MINDLIIDNIYFADLLAADFKKRFYLVSYDELQAAAYLGLVEAANKFKSNPNNGFRSFAKFRIIGAMRDYLREIRWGSRRKPVVFESIES
jgi:RNA polymerase sigma factor for flagellar operon FliA